MSLFALLSGYNTTMVYLLAREKVEPQHIDKVSRWIAMANQVPFSPPTQRHLHYTSLTPLRPRSAWRNARHGRHRRGHCRASPPTQLSVNTKSTWVSKTRFGKEPKFSPGTRISGQSRLDGSFLRAIYFSFLVRVDKTKSPGGQTTDKEHKDFFVQRREHTRDTQRNMNSDSSSSNTKVLLVKRPGTGMPDASLFKIVKEPVPEPAEGQVFFFFPNMYKFKIFK
jgi:hypothetical protein